MARHEARRAARRGSRRLPAGSRSVLDIARIYEQNVDVAMKLAVLEAIVEQVNAGDGSRRG